MDQLSFWIALAPPVAIALYGGMFGLVLRHMKSDTIAQAAIASEISGNRLATVSEALKISNVMERNQKFLTAEAARLRLELSEYRLSVQEKFVTSGSLDSLERRITDRLTGIEAQIADLRRNRVHKV